MDFTSGYGPGKANGCIPDPMGTTHSPYDPSRLLFPIPPTLRSTNGLGAVEFPPGLRPPQFKEYQPQSSGDSQASGVFYPQPTAYMHYPGQGESGKIIPLQIPCHVESSASPMIPPTGGFQQLPMKIDGTTGSAPGAKPAPLDPNIYMGDAGKK